MGLWGQQTVVSVADPRWHQKEGGQGEAGLQVWGRRESGAMMGSPVGQGFTHVGHACTTAHVEGWEGKKEGRS